jgi:hypothetical protein
MRHKIISPIVCAQLCRAFNGIVSMHACFPRTHLSLRHFVTMMTKHEVVQSPLSPISTLAQSSRFRFRASRGPHPCWHISLSEGICASYSPMSTSHPERACVLSTNLRQRCDISSPRGRPRGCVFPPSQPFLGHYLWTASALNPNLGSHC